MRVLFVASPLVGHVLPLVPLARAFRDAGHEVVVATAADGLAPARAAGLDVRDVAPGHRLQRTFGGVALRHPVLAARSMQGDRARCSSVTCSPPSRTGWPTAWSR